jgi:hypothetical protein
MKNIFKYLPLGFALTLGLSTGAFAAPTCSACSVRTAPEVDPALVVGALALLGGSITVLRVRRRK